MNAIVPATDAYLVTHILEGVMERGTGALSAVEEVNRLYDVPVISIASLADVLGFLDDSADPALIQFRGAVAAYRRDYGTTGG